MSWEYVLIGLIIGFITGVLTIRLGNRKLCSQKMLRVELEKKNNELEEYRKELINHFAYGSELLDKMAQNYRQLYEHMAKSSRELMPDAILENNPFNYYLNKSELNNDKAISNLPAKDYSECSSSLFSSIKKK
ncbi:MAG: Z-ring associated protein ZapG [Arsenophonus sp.]